MENKDVVKELADIQNKHNLSWRDLGKMVFMQIRFDDEVKLRQRIQKNKYLQGKCFCEIKTVKGKEMKRFYKVISYRSSNDAHVECLVFDEYPNYNFNFQGDFHTRIGDSYLGSFDYLAFYTEDVLVNKIAKMDSISLEEYNRKACAFLNKLLLEDWNIPNKEN